MTIATYDIGTTAVKGVLINEKGEVLSSESKTISTIFDNEKKEQRPQDWYDAFCRISKGFAAMDKETPVEAVIMSGQMQDVIPVDRGGCPVGNAVLYSDGRAAAQARELIERMGKDYLESVTGNHYDGSLPLPKLMWIKENQPDLYGKIHKVLISAKDYIILQLTGRAVGDMTACSTAGAMDMASGTWDSRILSAAGIDLSLLPELYYPHQAVGTMSKKGAEATGFDEGIKVYAGVGDAGAATLASGIRCPGEYNINLGTSGWVSTISRKVSRGLEGIFNLAAMEPGSYINVVPFLNAGNVHKWISSLFTARDSRETIDYTYVEERLRESSPGSGGVVFLPYLNGERFPVMDSLVKGSFLGITAATGQGDMIRSCLEGVAFSIRQGIECIGVPPKTISVIGGGGRVSVWNQILADILDQTVYVYKDGEMLPALALGAAVLLAEGRIRGYSGFTDSLQGRERSDAYEPDPERAAFYDGLYRRYLDIYPAVKRYYHGGGME